MIAMLIDLHSNFDMIVDFVVFDFDDRLANVD
jgi:hypothetical protein